MSLPECLDYNVDDDRKPRIGTWSADRFCDVDRFRLSAVKKCDKHSQRPKVSKDQ
jgi:hypothetical protein